MRARRILATAMLGALTTIGAASCGPDGGGGEPTPTHTPVPSPTPLPRLWVLAETTQNDSVGPWSTFLIYSDDLGASWQSLTGSGLADTTTAIDFVDARRGVAVGRAIAQRTSDGGRSWTTAIDESQQASGDELTFAGAHLDEDGTASVVGSVGDAGFLNAIGYRAWLLPADGSTPVSAPVTGKPLAAVDTACLTRGGYGVATGSFRFTMALVSYATTLGTSDGGASWAVTDAIQGGSVAWFGTACAGERDLWRFGNIDSGGVILPTPSEPAIAHSDDGGATWTAPADITGTDARFLAAGAFPDRETGWVCGGTDSAPVILRTGDAGTSFVQQSLPDGVTGSCVTIAFASTSVGLAGGGSYDPGTGRNVPLLLVTRDGGATWSTVALPADVERVVAVDATP